MKIQQALDQIKLYINLGQYEHYVELVLKELYLAGKWDENLEAMMRDKVEMLTEEQMIERERVSGFGVSKDSIIL